MAVTIVATAGSATANSFVTLAEWATYMEARLNSGAFDDATTDTKNRALVEATRELDSLAYQGWRTDSTQALSWPRTGVKDPDAPADAPVGAWTGFPEYDDDVIPVRLKEATYELALEFLRAGTTDLAAADEAAGIKRERVGPLETEWTEHARPTGLARYPRVVARLGPLLEAASGREVSRS